MTGSSSTSASLGSRGRIRALVPLIAALVVVVGCLWWPRVPEGQRFADAALAEMDAGWFAFGPRWDLARAEAWEGTRGAVTVEEAITPLKRALWVAGGSHSSLYRPRGSLADSEKELPGVVTRNGISTITVPGVLSWDEEFLERFATMLAADIEMARGATSCGWILDLRGNGGGNFMPMLAGLSALLPDGKVAGFRTRIEEQSVELRDGQVVTGGEVVFKVHPHPKTDKSIAVVQSRWIGSSGELILLAFNEQPNARSFGERSTGLTTVNKTVVMDEYGYWMNLTVGLMTNRNGRAYTVQFGDEIHGAPVPPDVRSATPDVDAEEWLRARC